MRPPALNRAALLLCVLLALTRATQAVSPEDVRRRRPRDPLRTLTSGIRQVATVYVIQMNHLDVGFDGIYPDTGFQSNVLNKYFDEYFPKAIAVAARLEANATGSGSPRLVYTTHAFLVSMYLSCPPGMGLHCPNASAVEAFKAAARRGHLAVHAFPFNSELEIGDASLVDFGLRLAADVAAELGIAAPRTMSQRDVPGTTRALLPLLAVRGVRALSVGVNGEAAPPAVPRAFVWQDAASNSSVLGMWYPRGYGGILPADCVYAEGLDAVLALDFRGDNAGPPDEAEVRSHWAQLQASFPNATVKAGTWDDFVDRLESVRDTLPVVTQEIGDTWIYGVPSDPLKTAPAGAAMRGRTECLAPAPATGGAPAWAGACSLDDPRVYNFSRLLLKYTEHTWGLDVKTTLLSSGPPYPYMWWGNDLFRPRMQEEHMALMTQSWLEQRAWALD